MREEIDVAIFGAGPAGCSAAIALINGGITSVQLFDMPRPTSRFRIGESAAPNVQHILDQLKLQPQLSDMGHLPCDGNCSAWGASKPTYTDYIFQGHDIGWHLNRKQFDDWLKECTVKCGAKFHNINSLSDLRRQDDGLWDIKVCQPDTVNKNITAGFIIDATGRNASIALRLGSKKVTVDHLVCLAILCSAKPETPLQSYSMIEAVNNGWWYAATIPLQERQKTVVCFMTDCEIALDKEFQQSERFLHKLKQSKLIYPFLNSLNPDIDVMFYPAYTQYIDQICGDGWLAIGDAALGMDPLTSSGINSALSDGLNAAHAIQRNLNGDPSLLDTFTNKIKQAIPEYLKERRHYYSLENRWFEAPFWKNRNNAYTFITLQS